jgi:phosphate-selective porin
MKKATLSILAASLLGMSVSAIAAEGEQAAPAAAAEAQTAAPAASTTPQANQAIAMETQWRTQFKKLDKNHDGVIDRKEARKDKGLYKEFKKVAKNGKLNETEFLKWQESKKPRS